MEDFETTNLSTSSYGFSHIGFDDLGATEYTLVTIAVDNSTSISSLAPVINTCLGTVIKACALSPRADNLMVRVITFDSKVNEHHGFKLLMNCNPDDYLDCVSGNGMTSLNDAAVNAIEAANVYATSLKDEDYDVNGLVVIISDGCENDSTNSVKQVADVLKQVQMNEQIDGGLHSILIGCEQGGWGNVTKELDAWKTEAGFSQYVPLTNVDDKSFAKIAQFISRSISSQSQALATNGPSKSLSFDDDQQASSGGLSF